MAKNTYTIEELEQKANAIRIDIIKMLEHAGSGHSAGPLDLADILTALYFDVLKHDPKRPDWDDRDLFILSNGHCAPVLYATMAHAGYFDKTELRSLRRLGSRLQGHPERERLPGIETTSGPLGEGLGQAAGMALAMKIDRQSHRWVYCMMGDGELNEGVIWESAMLINKYKLHNLIGIVDRNNIQIDGTTEHVMPLEDLRAKWEAFGWHVVEIDGHNIEAFIDAVAMAKAIVEKPVVIIAHTIPGKGVDFMEYDYHWHGTPVGLQDMAGAPPKNEQARIALKELRSLRGKISGDHD
jgi:transketolase